MEINFKAQLTPEDYVAAQRLHTGIRIYVMLMVVALLVLTGIALASDKNSAFHSWEMPTVVFIFLFIYSLLVIPWNVARRTRKIFAQQKSLQIPYECWITEDAFRSVSEIGEGKLSWRDFHKWKANDKLVLVYQSDRIFHIFPRRWFASDNEFLAFKSTLVREIGPRNKPRKPTVG